MATRIWAYASMCPALMVEDVVCRTLPRSLSRQLGDPDHHLFIVCIVASENKAAWFAAAGELAHRCDYALPDSMDYNPGAFHIDVVNPLSTSAS